ncbi:ABC transporter permease subunit [Ruminococcus sp.]|uniref:ABC transporter permease n=1 Tax=Ruminococcus sp. TaxID=41978 RepID=UPI0025FE2712|nr:ABC transporter permease subunit [Ruminococcus sp.]MCR4639848.1 ABC transporter permease subunit [Ruminococcus sp.]
MTLKKRYLRITHLLFIALLLIQLLPDKSTKDVFTGSLIAFAVGLEIIVLAASSFIKKEEGVSLLLDITGFIYILLGAWSLATAKFNVLNDMLFPAPGKVLHQFTEDRSAILTNIVSSLGTTVKGFLIAAAVAIPLGLFIGWSARVGGAATYITKFFSSIPPIVYIPYGIALLPTFKSVSVFVIFLATFWPVFAGTMSGVLGVDKKIIDSAKVLNVSKPEMLFRVILPASLQQIFLGCNQGLSVSFILLTSAEMIGARDGMGYYVKYYSDFGDYTRTITGLLVIGFVVIGVTFLFNKLQNRLLRWKR